MKWYIVWAFGLFFSMQSYAASVFAAKAGDGEVAIAKNSDQAVPIASITKLMSAVVLLENPQPLDEKIEITEADIDTLKHSSSRLRVGSQFTRGELINLSLASSENRATHALARHYPGGVNAFVEAMNQRAKRLGMRKTSYVEPTGLSQANRATARDLGILMDYAERFPQIKEWSTTKEMQVTDEQRSMDFRNTNRLVRSNAYQFELQKTGFIREAGHCVVSRVMVRDQEWNIVVLGAKTAQEKFQQVAHIITQIEKGYEPTVGVFSKAIKSKKKVRKK
jgi:D-alanyl-D-alanine endopeptidase (penicillin-binding protein 7)